MECRVYTSAALVTAMQCSRTVKCFMLHQYASEGRMVDVDSERLDTGTHAYK